MQTVEQGPGDILTGLTAGTPDYLPHPEDDARLKRLEFAYSFRDRLNQGVETNGIRPIAIMAGKCRALGIPVINGSIGDIEGRMFPGYDASPLASELGLDPLGETYRNIREFYDRFLAETKAPDTVSIWRYQPEAIGLTELREEFASFMRGYGFPYRAEHTVLAPGSLPGLDNVIGAVNFMAHREGVDTSLIFPVPGFTVVEAQAKRRLVDVVRVPTDERAGFLVTPETLFRTLGKPSSERTLLYLTPMNNPTSTVYDHELFRETIRTFVNLRPYGFILQDLAYLEQVDERKAAEIVRVMNSEPLDRQIGFLSMSKMFGVPGLRQAAIFTQNPEILKELQAQWQVVFASLPGPAQLDALGRFRYVPREARRRMYDLFCLRQDILIREFSKINDRLMGRGEPPLVDLKRIHRDVPMYLYVGLLRGDFLDVFVESGILGVPGSVFGDDPSRNMVRYSTGIEDLHELE